MLLLHLLTDFVMRSAPVLEGSVIFVTLQMMLGAVSPLRMILSAARRENAVESVLLSVIPAILVVTVAIVQPLLFGSFLGRGFQKTDALAAFLAQPGFFWEALAVAALFVGCASLYTLVNRRQGRMSWRGVLLNLGLESVAALAVLLLAADFLSGGGLFYRLGGTQLKWFVYGVFLLAYKTCLFLVSLLWHFLFSERRRQYDFDLPQDCRRRLRAYLTGGHRAIGLGLLLFAAFFAFVALRPLYLEDGAGSLFWILVLLGGAEGLAGAWHMALSLFPALIPCYRRILGWGEEDFVMRELCIELFEQEPVYQSRSFTVTAHYLLVTAIGREIYSLALLERAQRVAGQRPGIRLFFGDGGRCTLDCANPAGREAVGLLLRRYPPAQGGLAPQDVR